MTLRPDDSLAEALRVQAEQEGRSQSAIALDAISEYIERRRRHHMITAASKRNAERYSEALERLGSI